MYQGTISKKLGVSQVALFRESTGLQNCGCISVNGDFIPFWRKKSWKLFSMKKLDFDRVCDILKEDDGYLSSRKGFQNEKSRIEGDFLCTVGSDACLCCGWLCV